MTIDEAIIAFLKTAAAVTAICGQRVMDAPLPQGVQYPAVGLTRVSTPRGYVMEGADGVASPRFQFDCCAASRADAKGLADAIRAAFNGFAFGSAMAATGPIVQAAFPQDERASDFEDGNQFVRCVELDIEIWHAE